MHACTETCEHDVPGYTAILIYIQSTRVSVCVCGGGGACLCAFGRAGDSVSARVLCLSVCQFDFALYD